MQNDNNNDRDDAPAQPPGTISVLDQLLANLATPPHVDDVPTAPGIRDYFTLEKFPTEFLLIEKLEKTIAWMENKLSSAEESNLSDDIIRTYGSFEEYLKICCNDIQNYLKTFNPDILFNKKNSRDKAVISKYFTFLTLINDFFITMTDHGYFELSLKHQRKFNRFMSTLVEESEQYDQNKKDKYIGRIQNTLQRTVVEQLSEIAFIYIQQEKFLFAKIIAEEVHTLHRQIARESLINAQTVYGYGLNLLALSLYYISIGNLEPAGKCLEDFIKKREKIFIQKRKAATLKNQTIIHEIGVPILIAFACQLIAKKHTALKEYCRAYYFYTLEHSIVNSCDSMTRNPINSKLVHPCYTRSFIAHNYHLINKDTRVKYQNIVLGIILQKLGESLNQKKSDVQLLAQEKSFEIISEPRLDSLTNFKIILNFKDQLAKQCFIETMPKKNMAYDFPDALSIEFFGIPGKVHDDWLISILINANDLYLQRITESKKSSVASDKIETTLQATDATTKIAAPSIPDETVIASNTSLQIPINNLHKRQSVRKSRPSKKSRQSAPVSSTSSSSFFSENERKTTLIKAPPIILTWSEELRYDNRETSQDIHPLGKDGIFYGMLDVNKLKQEGIDQNIINAAELRVIRGHFCGYSQGIVLVNQIGKEKDYSFKIRLLGPKGKGDIRIYGRMAGMAQEGTSQLIIFDCCLLEGHKLKSSPSHKEPACTTTSSSSGPGPSPGPKSTSKK